MPINFSKLLRWFDIYRNLFKEENMPSEEQGNESWKIFHEDFGGAKELIRKLATD
jgi:hypothetical protein